MASPSPSGQMFRKPITQEYPEYKRPGSSAPVMAVQVYRYENGPR